MAEEGFRLPGSSYDVLSQIIRAYGREGDEADRTQLARMLGIAASEISRNAAFLTSVGILEEGPGRRKSVTPVGKRLARAIDHAIESEVERVWQEIIGNSEFLSRLVTAVEIRNGMEPESLSSHIAFSAGQPKSPKTMTGARTVAAVLEKARVIELHDGKYVPVPTSKSEALVETPRHPPPARAEARERVSSVLSSWRLATGIGGSSSGAGDSPLIQLQVQVQVTPGDLPELADQLRQFVQRLDPEASEVDEPKSSSNT